MYFFGTLIGVLGALQADLSLETRIGNSRGEEKCIVFELGFAGSRFAAKFFPNSHKRACSQATAYPGDMINRLRKPLWKPLRMRAL